MREYLGQPAHMQGVLYEKALRDRDTHSLLRRQVRHRREFNMWWLRFRAPGSLPVEVLLTCAPAKFGAFHGQESCKGKKIDEFYIALNHRDGLVLQEVTQ